MAVAVASYEDLESVVKLIEFIFNVCGINVCNLNYEETLWKRSVRKIPTVIILISPIAALISFFCNIQDYIKAVGVIFAISGTVQVALKRCIFQIIRDDIIEFIEKCKIFRRNQVEDIQRACDVFHPNKVVACPSLVIKPFLILYLITDLLFCIEPLLGCGRKMIRFLDMSVGLPLESPLYELNYCYTLTTMLILSLFTLGMDAILIFSVSEICLQIDIINLKLFTLGKFEEEDQRSKLREISLMHWEVSSLVRDVNNIFSKVFLVQFATSFVAVSTSLFMITINYHSFFFGVFNALAQLFLYCIYGEIVKKKFEKFIFMYYDNSWYELDLKEKKSMITMMTYAQATPTLKAVGYIELSMETYFQILKAAYSYLAVMQNFEPEP